jgi:hypothetical protein
VVEALVPPRWLLLIHQIPPKPAYLRVKVGRRLQGLGAVPVKNSVYVLPRSEQALEDFHWVRAEIVAGGGDASVCEAGFLEGLSDQAVEALFNSARDADYSEVGKELRKLQPSLAARGRRPALGREQAVTAVSRLRRRFEGVAAMDFFRAPGRNEVEALLAAAENALRPTTDASRDDPPTAVSPEQGRTWVTRSGVFVDRIASAWLIRRFIDEGARFKFVRGHAYKPQAGEVRFDMFEAEFTHDGDLCTFEVLVRRFRLEDPALRHLAEIVHDIDLKDSKFSRPEAPGLEHLLAGIAMRHPDDVARLGDGSAVFEGLYEYFRRKK